MHVEEVGLREAPDGQICLYAHQAGYIVVTKDRDFLPAVLPDGFQVLWVRTGNCSNEFLFQRLDASWTEVLWYLETGTQLVELR